MAARTRLLERVALIAQEKLNQPERALKAYERILATDPRNRGAALALLPLYRKAQKWPRLLATYEVLLGAAAAGDGTSAGRAAGAATRRRARSASSGCNRSRWRSSGARARSRRRPRTRPCARISNASPARPTSGATWRRAVRGAHGGDRPTPRSGCGCCAGRCASPRRACSGRRRRARRPRQILTEIGFDEEADAALEQILTQTKAWGDLAKLLHARADRAPDAAERVRLLFRIAQLEEERVVDAAAATVTWKKILEAEPTNERALRALIRLSEARQDWAGVVEGLRRDLGDAAGRRTATSARRCCCASPTSRRSGSTIRRRRSRRTARCCRRTRTPRRRWRASSGCMAGGYADRAGDRAADAAVLRAHRRRGQAGGGERGAAGGRRHARREGRAAGEAARALQRPGERSGGRLPRRHGAVRDRSGRREEPGRAGRVRGGRRERPASWPRSCGRSRARPRIRSCAATSWWSSPSCRRSASGGRRTRRRSTRRSSRQSLCTPARSGRSAACTATRSAGASCGRLLDDAAARGAGRARAPRPARADRRSRRGGAGRPGPRAGRLREDAGAGRGGSAGASGARPPLRGPRALARPREPARHPRRFRVGSRGAGAGVPPRRAARQPPARTSPARSICSNRSSGSRPTTRARAACWRSWSRSRSTGSGSRRSSSPSTRRAAPGRGWRRSSTSSARSLDGAGGSRAAGAHRRPAGEQAAGARRGAGDAGGRCWPPIPATRTRCPRSSASERRWNASPSWSTSTRSWRSSATPSDIAGRSDLLSRAAKLYAGKLGNRRAAIDAWKLVLGLDPNDVDTTAPAAAALETPLHRDGGRRRAGEDPGHAGALGAVRRRRARRSCSASPSCRRSRWATRTPSVATLRSILEIDPQEREAIDALDRIFEAGAQHRQRVEILRKRIDLAGDAARAPGAVAAGRGPARARRRRRRRGDRRLRQHPRREPAGRAGARDAGAPLRAAGTSPAAPGDPRAAPVAARPAACAARASALLRQIAALLEGPLGDPGRGARALARGAGVRRPATAMRWRRWNGSWRRAPTAGCGWRPRRRWSRSTRAAGASPSWRRWCASTSRRRPTRGPGWSS